MSAQVMAATERGAMELALRLLRRGEVVAFPTDTVYGIGAHVFTPSAVEALYKIKGRQPDKAIPLLLASPEDMAAVALEVPPLAWLLAERFWPGGLTLVLQAAPHLPAEVTAGGTTVAVRLPDHAVPLALINALGAPLAATSANRSGEADPVTAAEIGQELRQSIALILDGGACRQGQPSTVLDLTVEPPALLRRGAIAVDELSAFVPI
jgi:L-threonylcarbamoyladenylate synthase